MLYRQDLEKKEYENLSVKACKSADSRGRLHEESKCLYRTDFQRDRDRIIHSKAFRRLMNKTQVFLAPEGDHYRTRLTHTIEVSQIARTIARALNLNEDLTEAISLGHDLGHTPFGHNGEAVLNYVHKYGFRHNEQSLRVVDFLEVKNNKNGMNLTHEVRDGILNHNGKTNPFTLEGQVVKLSDRIAYINHDIDDAIRSGVIKDSDLPKSSLLLFGNTHGTRIDAMINNVISYSDGEEFIALEPKYNEELMVLRTFMFEHVYKSDEVKKKEDLTKIEVIITTLYDYFLNKPEELPDYLKTHINDVEICILVKDYIAGMTDRYAMNLFNQKNLKK